MSLLSSIFFRISLPIFLVSLRDEILSNSKHLPYDCHRGTYLHTPSRGPDFCLPCTEGVNFMSESFHTKRKCYNCSQIIDENLEVLVSPCNKTHDTEILCRDGFYRWSANRTCIRCSVCEHVARTCQGYDDAVCCPQNFDAVFNNGVSYECKERPVKCGTGEFLSLKTEQCTPCHSGTFMTSDKHNHTNCELCQTLDDVGPYKEIVQPCNRTQPTIFECQEGYFRNLSLGETSECQPCEECQNLIQKCGPFNNSVCCDLPDTRVDDTGAGLVCVTKEKGTTAPSENLVLVPRCKKDEEAYYNPAKNVVVCLRYQNVTYVQEVTSKMLFHEIKKDKLDQTNTTLDLLIVIIHWSLVITLVISVIILKVSGGILSMSGNSLVRLAKILEIVLWVVTAFVGIKDFDNLNYIMLGHILASFLTAVCLLVFKFTKLKTVDIDGSFAFSGVDRSHKQANSIQTSPEDKSLGDADTDLIPTFEIKTEAEREAIWIQGNRREQGTDNTFEETNSLLSNEAHFHNTDVPTEPNKGVKELIKGNISGRKPILCESCKRVFRENRNNFEMSTVNTKNNLMIHTSL